MLRLRGNGSRNGCDRDSQQQDHWSGFSLTQTVRGKAGGYNPPMPADRLASQIAFLVEADRLKSVERRTPLVDGSRLENSAEHSWHLALAALILREYVSEPVDIVRVLELVTVHDLVEIDAGDAFAYDSAAQSLRAVREQAAADRLFGLLPAEQRAYVRRLWEEFEAQETPESRFANALDRIQPLFQNASSGGGSWRTHDLTRADVLRRMAPIETTMPALWPTVVEIVEAFCAAGVLRS
jgi:putative hydrolase of HD superfamily